MTETTRQARARLSRLQGEQAALGVRLTSYAVVCADVLLHGHSSDVYAELLRLKKICHDANREVDAEIAELQTELAKVPSARRRR